jgi:hypothetical protein
VLDAVDPKTSINPFAPLVLPERLHPQFVDLCRSPCHGEARALITDLMNRMGDPNGKLVRHFQGDAFHSRLFELACFAYLKEAGLTIDRSHPQPDFLASSKNVSLALEAVTANPPGPQSADISLRLMRELSGAEVFEKVAQEFPRRINNTLLRKLAHNYHELPQCKGKPLVFMVAPFFEAGAVFYTDDALVHLFFGAPDGISEIEPFFDRPEAEPVSAVLYCNQFTVPRFLRLSTDFTAKGAPTISRHGTCYLAQANGDYALKDFRYRLGAAGVPRETWADGVTIFENPNARLPLPCSALPASSLVCIRDGYVYREVRGFHPVVSFTQIHGDGDEPTIERARG